MPETQRPRPLPLRPFHLARGARFEPAEGMERLVSYAGEEAEYRALYGGCSLFDVSDRGLLEVSGEARERFLQNLLTNDVVGLAPGAAILACLLSRQSKVLSLMRLFADEGRFLLDVEPGENLPLLARLLKYRISQPVEIADLTESFVRFSLRGPQAKRCASLAEVGLSPPRGETGLTRGFWRGVALLVASDLGRSFPRLELLAPPEAAESLWQALVQAGAVPSGWGVLEASRLEAGEPRHGADVSEDHLFSETDLPEAVSHTKGCYVGQEIVTRVRTRGKVNRIRAGLRVQGRARGGDPVLLNGAPAGRVTSCARSPRLGTWLAFAYLKPEAASPGTELAVASPSAGSLPATVADFPIQA